MKTKQLICSAFAAMIAMVSLSSCEDSNEVPAYRETKNPAMKIVKSEKKHDTALLLCTFGSTFNEPIKTFDKIVADYKAKYPNTDVYLSFTSRTCVNRVKEETGIDRYQPDLWLEAIGKAGYKRVAVQSLHVIPGEEYMSLKNTDVKKNFMIKNFPKVKVLMSECLVLNDEDAAEVASVLHNYYKKDLDSKKNIVLMMGHGNPDREYNANSKYALVEREMNKIAKNKNVIVGTVDYGPMLFYPEEGEPNPECVYSKLLKYCKDNNLKPEEITVFLVPFMSIAGDHAHNDLWGMEEGDDFSEATPDSDACWRLKLMKMGFKIDKRESFNANNGKSAILGLADHKGIRDIWMRHMAEKYDNADEWVDGEYYQ